MVNLELKELLESKYGVEITKLLYSDGKIITENIVYSNAENLNLVKNHIEEIFKKINMTAEFKNIDKDYKKEMDWAFDFSGWIGNLTDDSELNIKYMIVGLEPHIERFDFQITYGLSEKTPIKNDTRFSIGNKKIICQDDSDTIWTNMFNLFASESIISEVYEKKNNDALIEFLKQFYITDLCHFAPKGQANLIKQISNWSLIRQKASYFYLKNEIKIVKPEIIIAQGNDVFFSLLKFLEIDQYITYCLEKGQIRVANYNKNGIKFKILSLPHIGSQMIQKTFWSKNLTEVRKKLEEINL